MSLESEVNPRGALTGLGLVAGSVVGTFPYYLFTGVVLWSVAATMSGCGLVFAVYGALFSDDERGAPERSRRRRRDAKVSIGVFGATLAVFLLCFLVVVTVSLLA